MTQKKRGMITKEFYLHQLQSYNNVNAIPVNTETNLNIGTKEYIPLFDIDFNMYYPEAVKELIKLDTPESSFETKYNVQGWRAYSEFRGFIKRAVEEGLYTIPFLLIKSDENQPVHRISSRITSRIKDWLKSYQSPYNVGKVTMEGGNAIEDVFTDFKLLNRWVKHTMRRDSTGTKKLYITNLMFLASIHSNLTIEGNIKMGSYTPLLCMMVKRSNMGLVKTHFITNTPMPSSLMELWVDSSVEAEGSKLKPHFRKYIKSKLEASGVEIKTFDNLQGEIMRSLSLPRFNTIEEKVMWLGEVLNEYYDLHSGKIDHAGAVVIDVSMNKMISAFAEEMAGLSIDSTFTKL